jgi:hypothetical protein
MRPISIGFQACEAHVARVSDNFGNCAEVKHNVCDGALSSCAVMR